MSNARRPLRIVKHRRRGDDQLSALRPWLRAMFAADAAEARGDADTALALMRQRWLGPDGQPYWRPWRVRLLEQVIAAGADLPGWAVSRWILAQSIQWMDQRDRLVIKRAMRQAVELRGGESVLPGCHRGDAQAKVIDHDWVFRQLVAYDLGRLDGFLRRAAGPALVARADHIGEWAKAAMGGYRLAGDGAWEDLATGELRALLDLGATDLVEPGTCVIGRVVQIQGGAMFETAPLPVPEDVASRVACAPDDWLDGLRHGCTTYGVAPRTDRAPTRGAIVVAGLHDFDLLTDSATGRWWPQWEWPLRAS